MSENDRVVVNGQELTQRVWSLIAHVSSTVGVTLSVGQGGFKSGSGADASGSTHDVGDVFDLRVKGMSDAKRLHVVNELRKWNGCAWLRSPEYGWTKTGPHIHCVMRDSYYGLSTGAQHQVASYDRGMNGLDNEAPDPFPQPPQEHYSEEDMALTPDEINKIADAVWTKQLKRAWDDKNDSAGNMLGSAQRYAIEGGFLGTNPKSNTPTTASQILTASKDDTEIPADIVDKIATAVADKLAARLQS